MRDGAEALRKRIDRVLRAPIDVEELGMRFCLAGFLLMTILAFVSLAYAGIKYMPWYMGVLAGVTSACFVCGLACLLWKVVWND